MYYIAMNATALIPFLQILLATKVGEDHILLISSHLITSQTKEKKEGRKKEREMSSKYGFPITPYDCFGYGRMQKRVNKVIKKIHMCGAKFLNQTSFPWSAFSPNQSFVRKALIESGADVDARDPKGNTALHAAASLGHQACMEALIRAGADVNAANGSVLCFESACLTGDTRVCVVQGGRDAAAWGGFSGIVGSGPDPVECWGRSQCSKRQGRNCSSRRSRQRSSLPCSCQGANLQVSLSSEWKWRNGSALQKLSAKNVLPFITNHIGKCQRFPWAFETNFARFSETVSKIWMQQFVMIPRKMRGYSESELHA